MNFTERDDEPATATATATPDSSEAESNAWARRAHAPAREAEVNTDGDVAEGRHADEYWPNWAALWLGRAENRTWMTTPPANFGEIWEQVGARSDSVEGGLLKLGIYAAGMCGVLTNAVIYALTYPVTGVLGAGWLPSLGKLVDSAEDTIVDPTGPVLSVLMAAWLWVAACYALADLFRHGSLLMLLAGCWGVAYLTTLF